jgi:hypothetical protein
MTYAEEGYKAMACAAAGKILSGPEYDSEAMKWGEYQHHLLQAVCRASVRQGSNGVAGPCQAYLVFTLGGQAVERFKDTFPGCRIWPWRLSTLPLSGKVQDAFAYLEARFADPAVTKVPKKDVYTHLGMAASNFSKSVVKHDDFIEAIGRAHIQEERSHFEKDQSTFGPWDGLDTEDLFVVDENMLVRSDR